MENLNYPVMKYLITALTVKDLGFYTVTDPETGVATKMLTLKGRGKGQSIPWVSTTANTIKNEITKAGAFKSVLVSVNAPAPCSSCHYEYGINVHRKWQQPGVQNDDLYPKTKSFGGVIEAIQTPSGGYLADSDKLLWKITSSSRSKEIRQDSQQPVNRISFRLRGCIL